MIAESSSGSSMAKKTSKHCRPVSRQASLRVTRDQSLACPQIHLQPGLWDRAHHLGGRAATGALMAPWAAPTTGPWESTSRRRIRQSASRSRCCSARCRPTEAWPRPPGGRPPTERCRRSRVVFHGLAAGGADWARAKNRIDFSKQRLVMKDASHAARSRRSAGKRFRMSTWVQPCEVLMPNERLLSDAETLLIEATVPAGVR